MPQPCLPATHLNEAPLRRSTRALRRLGAALALSAGLPAVALAAANAWPQAGHDAAHTYRNPQETQLMPKRFGALNLLWSQKLGQFYVGANALRQGVIVNCSNLYGVNAVRSGSGEVLWQRGGLPGGNCGSAATASTSLWLTTSDLDTRVSHVVALNPADGQTQWSRDLPDPQTLGLKDPTLADGRLYVADGRSAVHALSASDGSSLWRADTGCYQNAATAGQGQVFISTWYACASGSKRLIALDAADGSQRWSQPLSNDSWFAPMLLGKRVLVSSVDGWVRAFASDNGNPQWAVQLDGYASGPLVGEPGVVYAYSPTTVMALDAATGATLWRTTLPRFGTLASNLVLAAGGLYHTVIERDGSHRLGVINASTGKVGGRSEASMFGDYAQVAVANGRVQVSSNYGYLYEFGLVAP